MLSMLMLQVYAMKSMLKDHMILKNQVTHVKAERDVMAEADDPWIVKLMYSFQVGPRSLETNRLGWPGNEPTHRREGVGQQGSTATRLTVWNSYPA